MSTAVNWHDDCRLAAEMFEKGDHAGAAALFRGICARADVGQSDKALMYINLATVGEKLGRHDEALAAFDDARAQSLQAYFYVQQSRAVFLIRIGRAVEAIPLIEELLKHAALTGDYRVGCEENLRIARQHAAAGTKPDAGTAKFSEAARATL
jgi:tetratricopeptide (TPR) repeat protein